MLKITVLVDNEAKDGLSSEHGLSLFIEAHKQNILFDTGKSDIFLKNAEKLGIDLKALSYIFLSHNHYDHTGGLAYLKANCPIFVGKAIRAKCYSKHEDNLLYDISMPKESVDILNSSEVIEVESFKEISKNIYASGEIAREHNSYNSKYFYADEMANSINDIKDEISMLTSDGVLITGCCHSGLINTVETFKKHCPKSPIKTIIGGLHLLHCNNAQLEHISKYLNNLGLEQIILLHCTGDNAKEYFTKHLNCKVILAKTGNTFCL